MASSILFKLGYTLSVQASPSGSKGGLLLAWKSDIKLTSLYVSPNLICVHYFSTAPDVKCLISFIYGPLYRKCSSDFWSQLAEFSFDNLLPWLWIGDFNSITSSMDKLGGPPFNCLSHNDFGYFMNAFGMIDLGFSSNPFTWSNCRQGHGLIKEHLDRGVVSSQWLHEFPAISVTHLSAYSSDHNPLILNTISPSPSLPRPFRFEEFWTRDPMCGIVINEAWSTAVSGSSWINWIRFCISTSSFLVLLNGSPFGLFSPSRGLQQGDPLSHFLFIIRSEVISCLFYSSLCGFPIVRSYASLSHLLFVDDLVIFTTATATEAGIIQTCLDKYS